jgi:FixJ family two-component response regulator
MIDDVAMSASNLAERAEVSADPLAGLRAITELRHLLNHLEARHVQVARSYGCSWRSIADNLGVSRQATHQKHRGQTRV